MTEKCNLYRVHRDDTGYIVYRHCFDVRKCSVRAGAQAHRTATFVTEYEADDYASYRNQLVDQNGSDALMPVYGSREVEEK